MNLTDRLRIRFEIGRHPLRHQTEERAGQGVSRLRFQAADGENVTGWLVCPAAAAPWPVVLVIHAHGNRYDIGARELIDGRPAQPGPLGPDLAARGIASVCLDLPCFGERAGEAESAAAKAALWRGGSLAGRMLGELSSQIDWISGDARFDCARIGVYGLSVGATLCYWLAAVDRRIAALAQLCCLADLDRLIETGAHDLHGIYLTIPGLPAIARNGQIAGMVAPRPQLVCLGAQDPLTPPDALAVALEDLRAGYAGAEPALEVLVDPEVGHVETPAMRARVLAFFGRYLA
jgi:dienelactone hydrolase